MCVRAEVTFDLPHSLYTRIMPQQCCKIRFPHIPSVLPHWSEGLPVIQNVFSLSATCKVSRGISLKTTTNVSFVPQSSTPSPSHCVDYANPARRYITNPYGNYPPSANVLLRILLPGLDKFFILFLCYKHQKHWSHKKKTWITKAFHTKL